jgi:hypothetical protein
MGRNGATRSDAAELSYDTTCGRTRRSPWTQRGGIRQHMSPIRGTARASLVTTSTTMKHHRTRVPWPSTKEGGRRDGGADRGVHATGISKKEAIQMANETPSSSSYPGGIASARLCPRRCGGATTASFGIKHATDVLLVVPLGPASGGRPHRG